MADEVPEIVKKLYRELPHFSDGRIDYSDARKAPTVVTFLKHSDELLLLKRGEDVRTRRSEWGLVAGYLDELKPITKKGLEEVEEETGVSGDKISSIRKGGAYKFEEGGITYISYPLLVELEEKPEVKLSWEHTDYKWVKIPDARNYLSKHAIEELEMMIPHYGK